MLRALRALALGYGCRALRALAAYAAFTKLPSWEQSVFNRLNEFGNIRKKTRKKTANLDVLRREVGQNAHVFWEIVLRSSEIFGRKFGNISPFEIKDVNLI